MRIRMFVLAGYVMAGMIVSHAQTAKDAEAAFREQVVGKRFFVVGFSADPLVLFEWNGSGVTMAPPKVKTLGALQVTNAKLIDDHLEISGERSTMVIDDKGKPMLFGNTPTVLSVDFKNSDPAAVLPKLKDNLFFTDIATAINAVPNVFKNELPYGTHMAPSVCANKGALKPPAVIDDGSYAMLDPVRKHASESVDIALVVSKTGQPVDLWIARPTKLGSDEQAIAIVREYKFKPATCGSTPIGVAVMIEGSVKPKE
jgi:hypothetical protein